MRISRSDAAHPPGALENGTIVDSRHGSHGHGSVCAPESMFEHHLATLPIADLETWQGGRSQDETKGRLYESSTMVTRCGRRGMKKTHILYSGAEDADEGRKATKR